MTRFLLDTNMAGHYINRRHGVIDRARIEVANMMIAAIAMTLGNCGVVSSDSDFLAVPGLKLEDWRS